MAQRLGMCIFLSTALLLTAACTRLGEPGPGEQNSVIERLAQPNGVPASWGKLVAASATAGNEDWVHLWFQDDGGNVHMAAYNVRDQFLSMNAIAIHRY
jgi:hypothetical protein